jgi:phenylalanyl-tRNA synthetase alpha chain
LITNLRNTAQNSETKGNALDKLISTTLKYEQEALDLIKDSSSSKEVELFRVLFLGKNGKITAMMKEMKLLDKSEKPKLGEVVNAAVKKIEESLANSKEEIEAKELLDSIEMESLGNTIHIPSLPLFQKPPGSRHPISLVLDLTVKIFEEIGYEAITDIDQSPEIENDFYNFEALGMPFDHPARDMQDTFYINTSKINTNETLLLRTHTSAVQIREMQKRTPPFKLVVPGRVYRKDDVDATHYPTFHQVFIVNKYFVCLVLFYSINIIIIIICHYL